MLARVAISTSRLIKRLTAPPIKAPNNIHKTTLITILSFSDYAFQKPGLLDVKTGFLLSTASLNYQKRG
jgi:hypothetical protein